MSVVHTTDLYVAVRTKDQPCFNRLMDEKFEHTSAEETAPIFKSVRAEIPQRWDQDFRRLLMQWMAEDSTSAVLCQQSLSQLGFATLQYGDFPNVYNKIGVSYLLNNHPAQTPTHAANSILNTTAFFNCPKSFAVLLENAEFRKHLDLSVNPEQRKFFRVITHPDSRNSYYQSFWNSLAFNQNWGPLYLWNVLCNRNAQALDEFLIQHPQATDHLLNQLLRGGLLNHTHVAEALPHFPNVWQSCALKYILARNLLEEGTFEPIMHLSAEEQIQIFDGVAQYWCVVPGFTYIFDNDLRRGPIFGTIISNFPDALEGWVESDKDPLWHSHILPKTPELQRYILQQHVGQTQQNLKKSKI